MDAKIRQGLGLLVIAALAFLLSLPARGAESGAGQAWAFIATAVALVCGIVGAVLLAVGLLRPAPATGSDRPGSDPQD